MKSKALSMAVLVAAAGAFSAGSVEAQEATTMTADVIDIACYVNMGLKGEQHRECAQVCADAGLPLGFLGEDGNVYFATGEGMPAPPANEMLRPHAEHTVTVEGEVHERSGARSIVVSKVSM
ncbi:MAG: hypothetical protein R3266_12040 [Gemmatimonadota bacterium]|nr:hypothetical protein [Gemmatimonadota bacterium]